MKALSQATFWFRLGCGGSALTLLSAVLASPAYAEPLDPARLERLLAEGRAAHEQAQQAQSSVPPSQQASTPAVTGDPLGSSPRYAPELWAKFPLWHGILDPQAWAELDQALAQLDSPQPPPQPDPVQAQDPQDLHQQRLERLLAEGAAAHAQRQGQAPAASTPLPPVASQGSPGILVADTSGALPVAQIVQDLPIEPPSLPLPQASEAANPEQQRLQRLLEEGAAAHTQRTQAASVQPDVAPSEDPASPNPVEARDPQPNSDPIERVRQLRGPQTRAAALLPTYNPGSSSEQSALQELVSLLLGIDERDPQLLRLFPLVVGQINPVLDPLPVSPLPVQEEEFPSDLSEFEFTREGVEPGDPIPPLQAVYAPELLELFPLFQPPFPGSIADGGTGEGSPTGPRGSQIRQELQVRSQLERPLDPSQLNVEGDVLSFDADRQVGIAEGNARVQLADGTTITGDRLLFYQRERRLRSEGRFVLNQPVGSGRQQARQIQGRNLDFDLPSRTAQFESSLVVVPAEQPGTFMYVRSEETTALLGDQIFFENATITTSREDPITHYVQGDRVEIFPDDRVLIYDARVFAGGEQDAVGDISGGVQVGYFPLFVYSLRDHQWVLPGQSEVEGVFVKSSWAYHMDEYNFGGIRIDAIQNKGLGLGIVHDYILPIPDSSNYGRAQFYLVSELDENRFSSRFRVDHFFDFYAATILGHPGQLRGQFNINFNNTYRPTGGRNDNADIRLNATFQADLSTTTLNISRTGSQERGTYSLPITLNHRQQYGDLPWLTSDLRVDYNQRLNITGGQDFSDTRLTLGTQARPPGWLGNYQFTYRAYGSSSGDNESRRNVEFNFIPESWQIARGISFNTNLTFTQNQQPNFSEGGLNFFNKYEARSSLRFNQYEPTEWLTLIPGSLDYYQALYSTPDDQESTVSLNPRATITPNEWSTLDVRFQRVFQGNNSVPFQSASTSPRDTHRLNFNLSAFTPRANLPNVPPGFIAFEDDLPGESPIPLVFADDTEEDRSELADRTTEELEADIRNIFRFDATTGFDYITDRWDLLNASFTWNTTPSLFDVRLQTAYDLNEGEFSPVRLSYTGRTSTTFDRNLRSGLDSYEPGFAYSLQAVYDPQTGELPTYGVDLDFTLGTQWQNHWRIRLGLDEDGLRRLEVRRDLRDFEVRLAYDPGAELLRLEAILVAFPSRPVGLTQERGDFILDTPSTGFSPTNLLP